MLAELGASCVGPGIFVREKDIGNPEWARTPNLIDASGLYAQFEFWPLFDRRLVVPSMIAHRAESYAHVDHVVRIADGMAETKTLLRAVPD